MSKEPTITQDDLKAILADVTSQVDLLIKSAEKDKLETLAKSHPGEETSSEPQPDTSAVKSAPESSGPEASADEGSDEPKSAPPTEASPAPTEAAPSEEAPVDPAAEVGPIDPIQLKAEYAQLSVEDLQAHYMAAKEALVEAMAAQQPAPAPGAVPAPVDAPPAPVAEPAAPVAAAPAPAAPAPVAPPAEEPPMLAHKSEKDLRIETLEKNEKEMAESLNKLADVFGKVLKAPLRKSIASMTELGGEVAPKLAFKDMTQGQIDKALKDKISSGSLKKSDLDLIVAYDVKAVKIDQLAHLFV
jgi:hypothetical protein